MHYSLTDEHIHSKDEERMKIALYIVNTLEGSSSIYKEALKTLILELSDYYISYDTQLASISKEAIKIEIIRQQVLGLHAHYSKTQDNRSALLELIGMLKIELNNELEEYNDEED